MDDKNNEIKTISNFLKTVSQYSKNQASIEEFAAFIILNYRLEDKNISKFEKKTEKLNASKDLLKIIENSKINLSKEALKALGKTLAQEEVGSRGNLFTIAASQSPQKSVFTEDDLSMLTKGDLKVLSKFNIK